MNVFDIDELRRRGLDDEALFPTADILEAEERVWEFIELFCNQFFEEREFVLTLDGNGLEMLLLPIPCVELTSVTIDDTVQTLTDFILYNRTFPDDRKNPKIKYENNTFEAGSLNVELAGTFGYVESDGNPPPPLVDAAMKILVHIALLPLTGDGGYDVPLDKHRLIQETTDKYLYKLSANPPMNGATGIPEIDKILFMYRRGNSAIAGRAV